MPGVFISYFRENSEDVQRLATALRTHGVTIWLDREQIKPGTDGLTLLEGPFLKEISF